MATAPCRTVWPCSSTGTAPRGSPSELDCCAHFEVRPGLMKGLQGRGIKCQRRRETQLGGQRALGCLAARSGTKVETSTRQGPAGGRACPARPRPAPRRPFAVPGARSPSPSASRARELQRQPVQPQPGLASTQTWPEPNFGDGVTFGFSYSV